MWLLFVQWCWWLCAVTHYTTSLAVWSFKWTELNWSWWTHQQQIKKNEWSKLKQSDQIPGRVSSKYGWSSNTYIHTSTSFKPPHPPSLTKTFSYTCVVSSPYLRFTYFSDLTIFLQTHRRYYTTDSLLLNSKKCFQSLVKFSLLPSVLLRWCWIFFNQAHANKTRQNICIKIRPSE